MFRIFNFIILIPLIECLKSTQFCLNKDDDVCKGDFSHKCEFDKCSLNEDLCESYMNAKYTLRMYQDQIILLTKINFCLTKPILV